MRVLLDCRMATWTGVGRYSSSLTRALAGREDLNLVVVYADGEQPPVPAGIRVELLAAKEHPFSWRGMRELGRIVSEAKPDLTHCLHFPTPAPLPHPLVVTLHDLIPLEYPAVMPSVVKRIAYRWLNARATSGANAVITPSSYTSSDVVSYFPSAAGKTKVTLEAADDFASEPAGALPGDLAAWLGDRHYVLGMGSTRANKDLPTLLAAFDELAGRIPDACLVLAGDGDAEYLDRHLSATARSRASFSGRVDDPQLRALYAGARVFAFPSRYEGFGLPPVEAMSYGAPVVAADATSIPEVLGDAAVLFEVGDHRALAAELERFLVDEAHHARHVALGTARAAELTWERTAQETVRVYEETIRASR